MSILWRSLLLTINEKKVLKQELTREINEIDKRINNVDKVLSGRIHKIEESLVGFEEKLLRR